MLLDKSLYPCVHTGSERKKRIREKCNWCVECRILLSGYLFLTCLSLMFFCLSLLMLTSHTHTTVLFPAVMMVLLLGQAAHTVSPQSDRLSHTPKLWNIENNAIKNVWISKVIKLMKYKNKPFQLCSSQKNRTGHMHPSRSMCSTGEGWEVCFFLRPTRPSLYILSDPQAPARVLQRQAENDWRFTDTVKFDPTVAYATLLYTVFIASFNSKKKI